MQRILPHRRDDKRRNGSLDDEMDLQNGRGKEWTSGSNNCAFVWMCKSENCILEEEIAVEWRAGELNWIWWSSKF